MQVEIGQHRRNHRPLWCPFLRLVPLALLHHARLQPFLDQADDSLVSDPMLDELDQPFVIDFVEKCPNVQIEHPVHLLARNPDVERVQRIMLAAPRPEPVGEAQKVLFPDLVENRPHRVLNDLVLQRRDPQWSLSSIGFRYPDSPRRLRAICPTMDSPVQVAQPRLQASSIFFPRHSVHSRRCLLLQAVIARPEQIDCHMVQQGGEPSASRPSWLLRAHGPARLARFPGSVSGTG